MINKGDKKLWSKITSNTKNALQELLHIYIYIYIYIYMFLKGIHCCFIIHITPIIIHITPIPQDQSVSCENELRLISLTACLSKILGDFVVKWMVDDVKNKIDTQQFGSLKGTSTTFCLILIWLATLDAQFHNLC